MKSTIRRKNIITIAFVAMFLILIGVFIPKTYCSTTEIIRNTKKKKPTTYGKTTKKKLIIITIK